LVWTFEKKTEKDGGKDVKELKETIHQAELERSKKTFHLES